MRHSTAPPSPSRACRLQTPHARGASARGACCCPAPSPPPSAARGLLELLRPAARRRGRGRRRGAEPRGGLQGPAGWGGRGGRGSPPLPPCGLRPGGEEEAAAVCGAAAGSRQAGRQGEEAEAEGDAGQRPPSDAGGRGGACCSARCCLLSWPLAAPAGGGGAGSGERGRGGAGLLPASSPHPPERAHPCPVAPWPWDGCRFSPPRLLLSSSGSLAAARRALPPPFLSWVAPPAGAPRKAGASMWPICLAACCLLPPLCALLPRLLARPSRLSSAPADSAAAICCCLRLTPALPCSDPLCSAACSALRLLCSAPLLSTRAALLTSHPGRPCSASARMPLHLPLPPSPAAYLPLEELLAAYSLPPAAAIVPHVAACRRHRPRSLFILRRRRRLLELIRRLQPAPSSPLLFSRPLLLLLPSRMLRRTAVKPSLPLRHPRPKAFDHPANRPFPRPRRGGGGFYRHDSEGGGGVARCLVPVARCYSRQRVRALSGPVGGEAGRALPRDYHTAGLRAGEGKWR